MLRSNATKDEEFKKQICREFRRSEHCQVRIMMDDTAESSSRTRMEIESRGVRAGGAPDLVRTPQKNRNDVPSKLSLHRPKFKKVVDALTAPAGGHEG
jgi:hypothetical protein